MKLSSEIALPVDPWRACWGLAFSGCWLIPNFSEPWLSFDRELLAGFLLLALGFGLATTSRVRWRVPSLTCLLAALCVVSLLQSFTSLILFRGDAWLSAMYLIGFALSVMLGDRLAALSSEAWLMTLIRATGFAAIVSVGFELYQWFELDYLEVWVIDMPRGVRPFANLGQPNLLATLLCWGLVFVWLEYLRKEVRSSIAMSTAAFLMFGIVMTQSRTGLVVVGLFGVIAIFCRGQLDTPRYWRGLVFLALLFFAMLLSWSHLNAALTLHAASPLDAALSPGYRPQHWNSMLHAISEKPWTGWGWNQVSVAQQAMAGESHVPPELIHFSHDFLLDLLVWNGVPIGGLVIAFAIWWGISRARKLESALSVSLFMGVCAFTVHALLEYPHAYAFMLLPAGIMMGALGFRSGDKAPLTFAPAMTGVVMVMTAALTSWIAAEYYVAKQSTATLRYEMAHVGPGRNSQAPNLIILTQLEALLTADRVTLHLGMSVETVELLRKVAARYPSERALVHYAVAASSRGDADAAKLALVKLCRLYSAEKCVNAGHVWATWGERTYPFLREVQFPIPIPIPTPATPASQRD